MAVEDNPVLMSEVIETVQKINKKLTDRKQNGEGYNPGADAKLGLEIRRLKESDTYAKDFKDLAKYRLEQGLPVAGSPDDHCTAGKLKIGDNEYYGRNGHGKHNEVKKVFTGNPQTATHAEGDVFYQAKMAGETNTSAILITDRRSCRACGYNGGIRSMAKQMGITDLTIVSPGYEPIRFNPQEKPVPNPFK